MIKFVKLKEKDNDFDKTDVIIRVQDQADISDVVGAFKEFLLACGYSADCVKSQFYEDEIE